MEGYFACTSPTNDVFVFVCAWSTKNRNHQQKPKIIRAKKINPTTVEVLLPENQRMTFDFYGENVFRVFQDNSGGIIRDPEAKPEARILVDNPRKHLSEVKVSDDGDSISIITEKIKIQLDKNTALLKSAHQNEHIIKTRLLRSRSKVPTFALLTH